ncbi:MAG: BON domain-containing protein [Heteroscytonema crispum UTEX LB 1556]
MKKLAPLFMSLFLVFGAVACNRPVKTSVDAPDRTDVAIKVTDPGATEAAKNDAQSQIRRKQLNSDIRAREQRNNWAGGGTNRDTRDIASEVRSKLEANLPNSHLTVDAQEDGTVYVTGTVANKQQLNKVAPLAHEIKGVSFIVQKVTVSQEKQENS